MSAGGEGSAGAPKGGPERVGELLKGFLERQGLREEMLRAQVVEDWAGRVGEIIAGVTRPRYVSGDVLVVEVRSSAWLMELNLMKRDILERLNEGRREGRIEKLVFVLADR